MNPSADLDETSVASDRLYKDFRYDLEAHDNYIKEFDAYESMLMSKPYDSVSRKVQNGLSDGRTTTIYQERSARVVGQLPTGTIKAYGEKDDGVAALLDIIRQKWIYPNANSQAPFLQKLRNWQFNSSVYGFMPMFYDWHVNEKTGYIGPDCWLWHPRNFIPQIGRASIDDMDYCHAISYLSEDDLDDLIEGSGEDGDGTDGWNKKALQELKDHINDKVIDVNNKRDSFITRQRQMQAERGRIMVATRYEAGEEGHWVVFAPAHADIVLRDIPNPHKNGQIPFIIKYATPLFDNFYGLGDFQRAKPLQFASDGLDNFYFAGIKRGLYPPTIINPSQVVKSSITHGPGAVWLENVQGAIREYNTNPTGLNTYQSAKTIMNGAMLNQAGTTDTTQTAAGTNDPGFGKTPQAMQTLQNRESTRDNQDRFYLESALEQLIDRMMNLVATIGTETIPIDVYAEDLEQLAASGYIGLDENGGLTGSLASMLKVSDSGQSGRLSIKPELFKDITMRFYLDENSTAQQNKQAQLQSLTQYMQLMSSNQNNIQDLNAKGQTFDFAVASELYGQLSDVPNMHKLIRPMTPQEQQKYQEAQSPPPQPQQSPIDKVQLDSLYKIAPPDIQRQIETMLGFQPSQDEMTVDQQQKALDQTQANMELEHSQQQAAAATPTYGVHNGVPIADPAIAQAHFQIGAMANQPQQGAQPNANQ